jgi:hypothetical protein
MRTLPWCLAALLAFAHPLSAQQGEPPAGAAVPAEPAGLRHPMSDPNLLLVAGVTADLANVHPNGGLMAMFGRAGWGVMALGMGGRGGGYDSGLAAGAATRRLARGSTWNATVFGGYGVYGERGHTGIERDAGGLLAGSILVVRIGPLGVAGVVTHMTGTYDRPDVTNAFRFHVPRLSLGVAF